MKKKLTEIPEELREKLSQYIIEVKEKRKLGFNQLSLKSGLNPAGLNRLLKCKYKTINPYQLKQIAYALRVDYKELYKIVDYLDDDEESKPIDSNIDLSEKYKTIPLYSSISAGVGLDELDSEDEEFISVPDTKQFAGDVIAIKVNGDSMEYTIENGTIVFVRKEVEVPNKKVGAFIYNNQALLKRYVCIDDDCFLRSDNREYPDILINQNDSFEIVGRVIGQMESVD